MKEMSLKTKTIIAICCFVAIFAILVALASVFDFQISQILTKGSLDEGEYISHGFFPIAGEVFGTSPLYIFAALSMGIAFWFCLKIIPKKVLSVIGAIVAAVLIVVAWWFFFKDIVGYFFEHAANQARENVANVADAEASAAAVYEFRHSFGVRLTEVLMALCVAPLTVFAFKGIKEENLKKLGWMVLAFVAGAVVALLLLNIKGPIGRMRFRAINSSVGKQLIDDGVLKGFTPWYIANGQPSQEIIAMFTAKWPGASDAFKSFPSGHTCSAAMSYVLIMLPDAVDFKHKKAAKVICWVTPILITGLVAISRIVAGAHYMSDVTFGGTIGFLCMLIAREIFLCRGSHFKALFAKSAPAIEEPALQEETIPEEPAQIEETATDGEVVEESVAESALIDESTEK
ncbi:MAG: phosphatase PAP2 family protein [Clostridia bacterium]|nr:phosphatase PAP2 family protein [Clostridia bacterium]